MKIVLIITFLFTRLVMAEETCTRTAIVNNQRILVDTNTVQKGEGLKNYLEKDETAKQFLEAYRKGINSKWQNAALGTFGTALIIGGLLINSGSKARTAFVVSGVSFMAINFFVASTNDYTNETNLQKAIEEYNRRNTPKIYMEEESERVHTTDDKGLMFNLIKEF